MHDELKRIVEETIFYFMLEYKYIDEKVEAQHRRRWCYSTLSHNIVVKKMILEPTNKILSCTSYLYSL